MPKLPQVNGRRVIRALEKTGWYIHRTRGSHVIMKHNQLPERRVTIPVHPRPLKPYVLSKVLQQADLTVEELTELL